MEELKTRDSSTYDILYSKIKKLTEMAWADRWEANSDHLSLWLNNFQDSEKEAALYLLSKFMYFDHSTTRELMRRVYEDLYRRPIIFKIRKDHDNSADPALIENAFEEVLHQTRFLSVGNPSESSSHLLYYFRQENQLKRELFINPHQLYKHTQIQDGTITASVVTENIKRLIVLDDFCGSGSQATKFHEEFVKFIKKENEDVKVSYYSLYAIKNGLDKVRELSYDEVKSIFELDDSYKCFSESSRFFSEDDSKLKSFCKKFCVKYGKRLDSRNPLGYKKGQMMLGFHHNTPNNTLPIFWGEKDWNPIFKRYKKLY